MICEGVLGRNGKQIRKTYKGNTYERPKMCLQRERNPETPELKAPVTPEVRGKLGSKA